MICEHLGYSNYEDDGSYPDLVNQLIEIKLQTSPTIDLGLHSPEDEADVVVASGGHTIGGYINQYTCIICCPLINSRSITF